MATVARASSSLPFPLGSPSALPDDGAAAELAPGPSDDPSTYDVIPIPPPNLFSSRSFHGLARVCGLVPASNPNNELEEEISPLLNLLTILPSSKNSSIKYIFDSLHRYGLCLSKEFHSFLTDPYDGHLYDPEKTAQREIETLFGRDWCVRLFQPPELLHPWEDFTKENVRTLQDRIRAQFPNIDRSSPLFNQIKDALTQEIQLFPDGRAFLTQIQSSTIKEDLLCMAMEKWLEERNLNLCYQKWHQVSPMWAPAIPAHLTTESEKAAFAKEELNALLIANSLPTDFSQLGLTRLPQDLCVAFRRISTFPLFGGFIHPHGLSPDLDFSYNQIVNLRSEAFRNLYPASAQVMRVVNLTGNRIQSFTGDLRPLIVDLDGKLVPILSQQQLPLTQLPAAPSGNSFLDREIKRISSHHNLSFLVATFVKEFLFYCAIFGIVALIGPEEALGVVGGILLVFAIIALELGFFALNTDAFPMFKVEMMALLPPSQFNRFFAFFEPLKNYFYFERDWFEHFFSAPTKTIVINLVILTAQQGILLAALFWIVPFVATVLSYLAFLPLMSFFAAPLILSSSFSILRALARTIDILRDRYLCRGTLLVT